MKTRNPIALLFGWFALSVAPVHSVSSSAAVNPPEAPVPQTGIVYGRISNAATGANLENAEVYVGTGLRALTARDGSFTVRGVAPGTHDVRVFYTGLAEGLASVPVRAGQSAEVSLTLRPVETIVLDTFSVSEDREGQAASLMQQRNAINVKNVVSTDAFGSVADGNIGNFLVRLPGVDGDLIQGEVQAISVRGLPNDFTSINIDGNRASGVFTVGGAGGIPDRVAQVDQIPAEFIKEVHLTKAPTPDMPADSIGGSVNLVSKSALDFKETVLTYRVGVNHSTWRKDKNEFTPNAALTWLTRVGRDQNIGMALSLTYSDSAVVRDRMPTGRDVATGRVNAAGNAFSTYIHRIRSGASVKFDFRLSDLTDLYIKLDHSKFDYLGDRQDINITNSAGLRVADYDRVSRAQIEAGTVPRTTTNQTASIAPGATDSFTEILHANLTLGSLAQNSRKGPRYLANFGGRTRFGEEQELSYNAVYSASSFKARPHSSTITRLATGGGIGFSIDTRDPLKPVVRQTYGPSIAPGQVDLRHFRPEITKNHADSSDTEEQWNLNVDYVRKFRVANFTAELKSGFAGQRMNRIADTFGNVRWNYVGPDVAQFFNPRSAYTVYNDSIYPAVPELDTLRMFRHQESSPQDWATVGAVNPMRRNRNSLIEEVSAGYLQGQLAFDRLSVLGGMRFEHTGIDAAANYTDPRRPTVERADVKRSYQDFFPSLHFRYEFTRQLLGRVSYSTGAARPSMGELYPITTVSYDDVEGGGTVRQNDPGLRPHISDNFDASLEYYFEPAGVLSVGAFRKDVKRFIARNSVEIEGGPNNGFEGEYEGFMLNTTSNLGKAKMEGFEIDYNQRLTMLPKPFNGLGISGNYTRMKTAGTYADGEADLSGFVPQLGNLGVSYTWRKLEARVAWRYKAAYFTSYNADPLVRQRSRAREQIDFSVKYSFDRRLALFVDLIDLEGSSVVVYNALNPNRVIRQDSNGTRFNVGISGRF